MPNNTYKGDIGVKYNFVKNHDEAEEDNKTEDIFDDSLTDDDDKIYNSDNLDEADEPGHFQSGVVNSSEQEFSVLSDSEKKYKWEKSRFDADDSIEPAAAKPQKVKKERKRNPESEDDENYDFEIGNNAAGLKILMGLMLITFIVIISVLIYKLTVLTDEYESVQAKLEEAPTAEELKSAKDDILVKEQSIKQLTDELNRYKVNNALAGDLVETPEGSVYVVASNDTLGKIAQEYQVSINQIMAWNNLDNADSIKVGQKLIVKKAEETPAATEAATATATAAAN